MPKCLLISDSSYPNLALMKISTYKKSLGYEVGFNIEDPDEIYSSIVFDWHKHNADSLRFYYPNAKIDVGGSGYDLSKSLPAEIDEQKPDYSLYPGMDYDLGFTSRGCIRNCPFCVVPAKEGGFKTYCHPSYFHDPAHKSIVLMDNNILASREWFLDVTDWILKNNLTVDFNQGLDLRLVTPEIAERIAELKPRNHWRFAFDSLAVRDPVLRGLFYLKDAGVNLRHKSVVYVYTDGDADFNSALERCNILHNLGIMPYPMFNRHAKRTQRLTDLKRWTRPHIFFSTDFESYNKSIKGARN